MEIKSIFILIILDKWFCVKITYYCLLFYYLKSNYILYMSISNLITYNINSKMRDSGDNDNFWIKLDIPNDIKNQLNAISITQICLPKSYLFIDTPNNNFHLFEEVIGSENKQLINIIVPSGNYSKAQLYKKMSSLMTSSSLNNITYTLTDETTEYDTGRLKIITTNPNINKYITYFNNDLYECFGFEKNKEYGPFTDYIISPNCINLNRENNLYLKCNTVNNFNNDLYNGSNVLCVVYSAGNKDFSYIIQQYPLLDNMKRFKNENSLNFYVSNEDGDLIKFNGVDWSFVLNIFTYTPNKILYDKLNNYINYNLIKE